MIVRVSSHLSGSVSIFLLIRLLPESSFLIVSVHSHLSGSVGIFLFVRLLPESSFLILFGDLRADFLFRCCSVLLSDLIHFEASSADVLP